MKDAHEEEKTLKKRLLGEVIDLCKIFLICYGIVFLITTFLCKPVRVQGESMYPTLLDGEIGVMNVFGAKFGEVSRYDIVVVHNEEKNEDWVKRVIGLPGDTISCENDVLYINGEAQEQTFLDQQYVDKVTRSGEIPFTDNFGPITLADDEYFLMGDNRPRSYDSRNLYGVQKFTKGDLRGRGIMIVYPFDKMKILSN